MILPAVGSASRAERIEPIWLGPRPLQLPREPLAIRLCRPAHDASESETSPRRPPSNQNYINNPVHSMLTELKAGELVYQTSSVLEQC